MKVLVTGAGGQVGRALVAQAPPEVAVVGLDRAALDITDAEAVRRAVHTHTPDAVINAAAYTAVDRAESEPEAAFAVNRDGPAHLAAACADAAIPLLHLSTDYVFDGTKPGPYTEADVPHPLGVYGHSKWAGEEAVCEHLDRHLILRTAWVFSTDGPSFVHTILRLARERDTLRVVADQRGGPTPAEAIAGALLAIAQQVHAGPERWGTYHFAGQPTTTWHGFAEAIVAEARRHETLAVRTIEPITTEDYPTPAQRPANAVLDTATLMQTFGLAAPDWRPALARVVSALTTHR